MPNTALSARLRSDELLAALADGRITGRFFNEKNAAVRAWSIKKGQLFCFSAQSQDRYLHVMPPESRQQTLSVDGQTVLEITWNAKPTAGQVHIALAP
jgi:hypothetical protein